MTRREGGLYCCPGCHQPLRCGHPARQLSQALVGFGDVCCQRVYSAAPPTLHPISSFPPSRPALGGDLVPITAIEEALGKRISLVSN